MIVPQPQYPSERRTYTASFVSKLATGDSIQSEPTVISDDPTLTATLLSHDDTTVTLRVGGGTPGTSPSVIVTVNTAQAGVLVHKLVFEILD